MPPDHAAEISRRACLVIAALAGTVLVSLGLHDIAITDLGVPYPTLVAPPSWLDPLTWAVRMAFVVLLCRLADARLAGRSPVTVALLIGLLLAGLSEALRVPIIDFFIGAGWAHGAWLLPFTEALPRVAIGLAQGALGVAIVRDRTARRPNGPPLSIALIIGASTGILIAAFVVPWSTRAGAALGAWLHVPELFNVYGPPFGPGLYSVIYLTFLEAAVCALGLAALIWPALPGSTPRRIALVTVLLLGARGRYTALLLGPFWVHQPAIPALLSEAQFFLETLLLALLAATIYATLLKNPLSEDRAQGAGGAAR